MNCIPGCTDCCGRTPWSQAEFDKIPDNKVLEFYKLSYACPYCAVNEGCTVHEIRPFTCRIFGVVNGIDCPHGRKSDNNLELDEGCKLALIYRNTYFGD